MCFLLKEDHKSNKNQARTLHFFIYLNTTYYLLMPQFLQAATMLDCKHSLYYGYVLSQTMNIGKPNVINV